MFVIERRYRSPELEHFQILGKVKSLPDGEARFGKGVNTGPLTEPNYYLVGTATLCFCEHEAARSVDVSLALKGGLTDAERDAVLEQFGGLLIGYRAEGDEPPAVESGLVLLQKVYMWKQAEE